MEKGRGNNYIGKRKAFLSVQITAVTLVLHNVFNFQSCGHENGVLVILANSSFGNKAV